MTKATCVILNYNDWERSLNLASTITLYDSIEYVIVVDNCSTDNSREKLEKQLNEKLTLIRDNIQNTEIFCIMKNEYEQKLQKLRKDLAYYRDSNTKNEQLVKEAEKFRQKRLVEEQKQEEKISTKTKGEEISIFNYRITLI